MTRFPLTAVALTAALMFINPNAQAAPLAPADSVQSVLIPNRSPLVTFRLLFSVGAAHDPAGKEGLAALTAAMLSDGGSQAMAYSEIVEAMYPLAVGFGSQVDKEMTVFQGTTHIDNLATYYDLIRPMLLAPGFREDDFQRLKANTINEIKTGLREGNDEELTKEHLYEMIYRNHPYGHLTLGHLGALERITLDDVKNFYRQHYTAANLTVGLAGGYPAALPGQIATDFGAALPTGGGMGGVAYVPPTVAPGMRIDILQRETRATGISMGFPLDATRASADFPALALVASFFGEHRSSNSYLYQKIREARGLNYGDYAYVEYFPRGMYQFYPDPNLGRKGQIFQIWIRPVEPQNGLFTLRAALFEFDQLVQNGMTEAQFEATRAYLTKYANVLTQTQNARLGYALDSRYYGIDDYPTYLKRELAKLTLAEVNAAIRKYLTTDRMQIAIVTKDGDGLKRAIVANKPSPIAYNSPKSAEILAEDKIVAKYPIKVAAKHVSVIRVARVFE